MEVLILEVLEKFAIKLGRQSLERRVQRVARYDHTDWSASGNKLCGGKLRESRVFLEFGEQCLFVKEKRVDMTVLEERRAVERKRESKSHLQTKRVDEGAHLILACTTLSASMATFCC